MALKISSLVYAAFILLVVVSMMGMEEFNHDKDTEVLLILSALILYSITGAFIFFIGFTTFKRNSK